MGAEPKRRHSSYRSGKRVAEIKKNTKKQALSLLAKAKHIKTFKKSK